MDTILNQLALGREKGDAAGQLLQAYIETGIEMVHTHTHTPEVTKEPKGTRAGDQFIEPQ